MDDITCKFWVSSGQKSYNFLLKSVPYNLSPTICPLQSVPYNPDEQSTVHCSTRHFVACNLDSPTTASPKSFALLAERWASTTHPRNWFALGIGLSQWEVCPRPRESFPNDFGQGLVPLELKEAKKTSLTNITVVGPVESSLAWVEMHLHFEG
jgi:hypothetical protein